METTLHQETMALLSRFYDSFKMDDGFEWMLTEEVGVMEIQPDLRQYKTQVEANRAAEKWITRNMQNLVRDARREALEGRAYRARKAA